MSNSERYDLTVIAVKAAMRKDEKFSTSTMRDAENVLFACLWSLDPERDCEDRIIPNLNKVKDPQGDWLDELEDAIKRAVISVTTRAELFGAFRLARGYLSERRSLP